MYFVRIPNIIKKLFPRLIWDLPNEELKVYLTFDDGPHPEITPWILKQLKKTDAKATFFCLGEHVEKYPEIVRQILSEGHRIGNHGYKHLNGWKTNDDDYLQDYLKGQEMLRFSQNDTLLFRPAYGKIKKSQIPNLKSQIPNAQIINWSLMPGDFDAMISSEKVYSNLQRVQAGDIVVLHDNEKAWKHLQYCLPKFLEFCKEKNFSLNKLNL
ncbi:MAG: polysaccharide deacetylase family protein [Chitinophagales bacterium]|nr:polysaccharide deacetylase family protein [Chitinophagales bacterium]